MSEPSATAPLHFVDRASGELREETIYAGAGLRWVYGTRPGRLLAALLATRLPSRLYGAYLDSRLSRRKIPEFVATLGIDVAEAARPLADYESFNAFFTRRLTDGARPLAPPPALLSPADGRVWARQPLDGATLLPIKGRAVDVERLLGRDGARFSGGAAIVVRLCPADYHRVHWPAGGEVGERWRVGGRLHSVNPIAVASGLAIFDANQREVALLRTAAHGTLALIEVGAMFVGGIVQTDDGPTAARGAEKSAFRFGASTVIVLAEPGAVEVDADLLEHTARGLETFVRMGERVAVSAASAP